MKIEFSSQRREMLLFLTTNMAAVTSHANQEYRVAFRGSLLPRRFVFRMAEASAKRVTGDEPQRTMGRDLPAFLCAHIFIKRETSGYEAVSVIVSTPIRYLTLPLRNRHGAVSLRYKNRAKIIVLMC